VRIEYHRTLIDDRTRVAAFIAALKRHIRPGETTVADIGAGTGLLGAVAARLGARRVYMYEAGEIARVAEDVIKANRLRACTLFPCHSTEFIDPPKVDLVVSETLGNYALEEDIIETMADAATRHLAPGGALIPRAIAQHCAPVVSARIDAELAAWRRVPADLGIELDLAAAERLSRNNIYVRRIAEAELLGGAGGARVWDRIALGRPGKSSRKGEAQWTAREAATVYGFALWWTADLADAVSLSTAPDSPATHWEQLYLPLLEPAILAPGDRLALALRSTTSRPAGTNVAWTVTVDAPDGARRAKQALDLEKGFIP
jgi:protein arginine N-methyltransferase 1